MSKVNVKLLVKIDTLQHQILCLENKLWMLQQQNKIGKKALDKFTFEFKEIKEDLRDVEKSLEAYVNNEIVELNKHILKCCEKQIEYYKEKIEQIEKTLETKPIEG